MIRTPAWGPLGSMPLFAVGALVAPAVALLAAVVRNGRALARLEERQGR